MRGIAAIPLLTSSGVYFKACEGDGVKAVLLVLQYGILVGSSSTEFEEKHTAIGCIIALESKTTVGISRAVNIIHMTSNLTMCPRCVYEILGSP